VWPRKGLVKAPDWDPAPRCGHGLHGCLKGEGDADLLNWSESAVWQVVEVRADEVVELSGKVKFPRGKVLISGTRKEATDLLVSSCPGSAVIGAFVTAGDCGTATAGYRGTATAGDYGTATAGYRGTATAGVRGTATAGNCGTATAGDCGTATAGNCGTATAGDCGTATAGNCGTATAGVRGTATAGNCGTATAGVRGTATAGDYGTATAGYRGTATAGVRGTATAGVRGTLMIKHWDGSRCRTIVGYVGENGILPNVPYVLNETGAFVRK
jgi:hypothetical protein